MTNPSLLLVFDAGWRNAWIGWMDIVVVIVFLFWFLSAAKRWWITGRCAGPFWIAAFLGLSAVNLADIARIYRDVDPVGDLIHAVLSWRPDPSPTSWYVWFFRTAWAAAIVVVALRWQRGTLGPEDPGTSR